MTNPEVAIFMLSLFIFLVLLGFPIAFTLIAMASHSVITLIIRVELKLSGMCSTIISSIY